ncbi:ANTAR domain protein with unknown sensor [Actinobacteria bacterium OK074]|nr:ANTAR domain protein with unknown sensor [Actinobacteria bacterium OK074]
MSEHERCAWPESGWPTACAPPPAPVPLDITVRPAGDRTVVEVAGDIDIDMEQQLHSALREALARSATGVDLDLSKVGFCDCSGLNVLLRVRRLALADAKTLTVRSLGPAVGKLLDTTGTAGLFGLGRPPCDGCEHDSRHGSGHGSGHASVHVPHGRSGAPRTLVETEETRLPDDAEELRTEVVQLKQAMRTRPVIDLARGILMASFGLNPEDAWTVLVNVSQHTNTKLHHLAEELVAAVNGEPLPEPLRQQLSRAVTEVSR